MTPAKKQAARNSDRPTTAPGTVSIPRALSKLGAYSRSEGERLVEAGRVRIDGVVVRDKHIRIRPETARIEVDGEAVTAANRVYVALNKPRGLVTTREDPQGRATIYECLTDDALPFLAPVGRLDKASEGLILLSNDSRWAARLLDPTMHVDKTYHVQVRGVELDTIVNRVGSGVVEQETGELLSVKQIAVLRTGSRSGAWFEITLDEGKNRHLRRVFAELHVEVKRLVRVAIGPLQLGDLAKGTWRHLTPAEVRGLSSGGVVNAK